jgi:succinoglycan biosynthesis transport protein ExoP
MGGMMPAPARRGAQPAGWAFTAGDLLRVVRQRLIMVFFIWFFVVGTTIGLTAAWITYRPTYQAAAYIRVESMKPGDPLERDEGKGNVQAMEMLVKDQAVIVTSPDVLLATLDDPQVKQTSWYIERMDPSFSLTNELSSAIQATPVPATSFLMVSMRGRVAKELPTIVNTLVEKYVNRVNDLAQSRYRSEADRLSKETDSARKLLDNKNAEIEQFRAEAPASVFTPGATANPITDELNTLNALRVEIEMQKLARKQIYETLREGRQDQAVTAEMEAAIATDPILFQLRNEYDNLESQIRVWSNRLGPNHMTLRTMLAQLESLRERLIATQFEKFSALQTQQMQMAERDYLQAVEQEKELTDRYLAVEASQRDLDRKYGRYLQLLEEREILKANYDGLLLQREELNRTLRRDRTVRIDIASRAVAPEVRSAPQWFINVPIGVMLGLLLSVGLAVLLELADTSIRTPRDVIRHAALPVLATIPSLEDEEIEIERIETAAVDAPHSVVAEAFRQLRTNLFFSAPVEHQGVLAITSTTAGEGNTTVAVNYAASVALSGRRVLLIDANFRRPSLPQIFPGIYSGESLGEGYAAGEGFSNALIGQRHLTELVRPSGIPGLDVLFSGPTPPNPAELLGSGYLREMLSGARASYDQIILDAPPVLLVTDALVLTGMVDGVVMVCRFRRTSRGALLRARSQLEAINARVLGVVLNAVQTTRGGYFRKQYRAFYEYHEEDEQARRPRLTEKTQPPAEATEETDPAKAIGDDLAALEGAAAPEGFAPREGDAFAEPPEGEPPIEPTATSDDAPPEEDKA